MANEKDNKATPVESTPQTVMPVMEGDPAAVQPLPQTAAITTEDGSVGALWDENGMPPEESIDVSPPPPDGAPPENAEGQEGQDPDAEAEAAAKEAKAKKRSKLLSILFIVLIVLAVAIVALLVIVLVRGSGGSDDEEEPTPTPAAADGTDPAEPTPEGATPVPTADVPTDTATPVPTAAPIDGQETTPTADPAAPTQAPTPAPTPRPSEGDVMTTVEAEDYLRSLKPADLGLPVESMEGLDIIAENVVPVNGVSFTQVSVYSKDNPAGTNQILGTFLVSRGPDRIVYRLDPATGQLTKLEVGRG